MINQTKDILIFQKSLAISIGLNESIVVQQIDYWIKNNEKNKRNFKDGYYWTYNSFEKWHEEFPFWSVITIKRIFTRLEELGILISANYNKTTFDRTKWYRIDYDVLKSYLPLYQIDTMDSVKLIQPIPENTQRLTENGLNRQYNGFFQEKTHIQSSFNLKEYKEKKTNYKNDKTWVDDEVKKFIEIYINDLYKQKTGDIHPKLKKNQYRTVYNNLLDFASSNDLDCDCLCKMACGFLNSNMDTDYNINHFATKGILENRYYEELY